MRRAPRHLILILLLGLAGVLLVAPIFECFDESNDLEQGTDIVLLVVSLFVATGLFILCRSIAHLIVGLPRGATVPADTAVLFLNRSIQVEISPPKVLALLGGLRI